MGIWGTPPPKRPPQDGCPAICQGTTNHWFPHGKLDYQPWKTLRNSSWKRQLRKPSKSGKRSDILKVKNRHSKQPNNTSLSASYKGTLSSCLNGKILPLSKGGNMSNLIQTSMTFHSIGRLWILYDLTAVVYVTKTASHHQGPTGHGSIWGGIPKRAGSAFVPAHPSAEGRALWPHAHPLVNESRMAKWAFGKLFGK